MFKVADKVRISDKGIELDNVRVKRGIPSFVPLTGRVVRVMDYSVTVKWNGDRPINFAHNPDSLRKAGLSSEQILNMKEDV